MSSPGHVEVVWVFSLPFIRHQMQEPRMNRPYTRRVFLEGLRNNARPNLLYFCTCFLPPSLRWIYEELGYIWQAQSFSIRFLLTVCFAVFIAACVERWTTRQRPLREAECFKYSDNSLSSTDDHREIRLLKIHRWIPFVGVRTTLYPTSISSAEPYEAISYTWGSPTKTHTITVNGLPFQTTATTYNALYGCSLWWSSRLVWIDFVCIDQSNGQEKSKQVGSYEGDLFHGKSSHCLARRASESNRALEPV